MTPRTNTNSRHGRRARVRQPEKAHHRLDKKAYPFTRPELAALLGVHPITVSKWEKETPGLPVEEPGAPGRATKYDLARVLAWYTGKVGRNGDGLSLTDEDVTSFRGLMQGSVDAYNLVAAMPDEVPQVMYPRTPGCRPTAEENPRNAWYRKSSVKGAATGKLKGKTVALKDNIMLAGVPMMNGSATLEGYIPDFDATIVTRMLDAGAEIVGKTHCESFCMSGGSHTGAVGAVHNPKTMRPKGEST